MQVIQRSSEEPKGNVRKLIASIVASLFLLSAIALVIGPGQAVALQEGDYTYTVIGNPAYATVTGYTGPGGAITIPSTLGGYPVTHIGIDAFDTITTITSAVIPDSVVSIGDQAFQVCTSLTTVTLGSGLKEIRGFAFNGCSSLTTVTIPNSVTTIGDSAFMNCVSMTSVVLGSSLNTIGGSAFYGCSSLTSITFLSLTVPNNIGSFWIEATNLAIRGHAYTASNFPVPGSSFYGLIMGTNIDGGGLTAPTLVATAGNGRVDLTWTVPIGTGPFTYHLFRNNIEIWTGTPTSYTDADVIKGVTYTYSVAARNSQGIGPNSTAKTATPFGVPDAPWGLTSINGDGHVQVSWNAVNYTGPGAITYFLFRDGVEVFNGTGTTYDDTGLVNGVEYSYYAAASNNVGLSDLSGTITATPSNLLPSPPTGLTAEAGDGVVELTWQAPTGSPQSIVGYTVYRGLTSGSLLPIANVTGTSYIDSNVTNGQQYRYRVTALSADSESAQTTEAVATPDVQDSTSSGDGTDMTLIIVIVVIAAVGVVGAVLYMKRKK